MAEGKVEQVTIQNVEFIRFGPDRLPCFKVYNSDGSYKLTDYDTMYDQFLTPKDKEWYKTVTENKTKRDALIAAERKLPPTKKCEAHPGELHYSFEECKACSWGENPCRAYRRKLERSEPDSKAHAKHVRHLEKLGRK